MGISILGISRANAEAGAETRRASVSATEEVFMRQIELVGADGYPEYIVVEGAYKDRRVSLRCIDAAWEYIQVPRPNGEYQTKKIRYVLKQIMVLDPAGLNHARVEARNFDSSRNRFKTETGFRFDFNTVDACMKVGSAANAGCVEHLRISNKKSSVEYLGKDCSKR